LEFGLRTGKGASASRSEILGDHADPGPQHGLAAQATPGCKRELICESKAGNGVRSNNDGLVRSPGMAFSVIPAKAGIQSFQIVTNYLDSGFHRSDDFLQEHQ